MEVYKMVLEAITTVGFPIVISGVLFWYVTQKDKQHKEEISALKTSIDKNSSILDELKGLITYLVGELKNGK